MRPPSSMRSRRGNEARLTCRLKDLELVAQDQELDVAGELVTTAQSQCLEQAAQGEGDERE